MHTLVIGGRRTDRARVALASEVAHESAEPASVVTIDPSALAFIRPERLRLPGAAPRTIHLPDLERAFPDTQAGGTRLVLTQSAYIMQKWLDTFGPQDRIIATGDRSAIERTAAEALQGRGPWRQFTIVDLDVATSPVERRAAARRGIRRSSVRPSRLERLLARAFSSANAAERARLCRHAVLVAPESAVAALAMASACRERQQLAAARAALDAALRLAADWEAVHYEDGKFWLGCEDLPQARDAFARAARLMPGFSAAFINLGATLGELDQPEAAVTAFEHALASDPDNHTILNNIGVVSRELGRFEASEAALRRVTEIAPDFVFGYYNLGHTLFLAGRFREALEAYLEGRRRDPQKNRRQGCRIAMVRFASGDVAEAERDLWNFANDAPPDEREDLLLEAYEIGDALLRAHPGFADRRAFVDRIESELKRLG